MRPYTLLLFLLPIAACSPIPEPPSALSWAVQQFSTADRHTLWIESPDGGVHQDGAPIPLPTQEGTTQPILLDLPAAVAVSTGRSHACVLSAGDVHCWGDQSHGALGAHRACVDATGAASTTCPLAPGIMPTLPSIAALATGDDVTCALADDGRVYCWGDPADGRLGGSVVSALDPPIAVALPDQATRVIVQHGTVCALLPENGGEAWCWGVGYHETPKRLPLDGVIDLAIGRHHACAITRHHGLQCWGADRNGESGDVAFARACGTGAPSCEVGLTSIPLEATRVVVGERHACALATDSRVWCWGSNEVGQLGRDDAFLVGGAAVVLDGATALAASYSKTCALTRDEVIWCWGAYDAPAEAY
ncbi:MAG: hypothetical protein NT062_18205 [Proteobacteria bacterium]|nr:hypothetical protein [Pseudomonadota bacterium]